MGRWRGLVARRNMAVSKGTTALMSRVAPLVPVAFQRLQTAATRAATLPNRLKQVESRRAWQRWTRALGHDARGSWAPDVEHRHCSKRRRILRLFRVRTLIPRRFRQLCALNLSINKFSHQPHFVETFIGPHAVLCSGIVTLGTFAMFRLLEHLLVRGRPRADLKGLVKRLEFQLIAEAAQQDDDWFCCHHCTSRLIPKDRSKKAMHPKYVIKRKTVCLCPTCRAPYCNPKCRDLDHKAGRFLSCCHVEPDGSQSAEKMRRQVLEILLLYIKSEMLSCLPGNPLDGLNSIGHKHAEMPLDQCVLRMFAGTVAARSLSAYGGPKKLPSILIAQVVHDLPRVVKMMHLTKSLANCLEPRPRGPDHATVDRATEALMAASTTHTVETVETVDTVEKRERAHEMMRVAEIELEAARVRMNQWLDHSDDWKDLLLDALRNEPMLRGRSAIRAVVGALFVKRMIVPGVARDNMRLPFYKRSEPVCNAAADLVIQSSVRAITDEARQLVWNPICPPVFGPAPHPILAYGGHDPHPILHPGDTRFGYGPLFAMLATSARIAYSDAPVPKDVEQLAQVFEVDPMEMDGGHPLFIELLETVRHETGILYAPSPIPSMIQATRDRCSQICAQVRSANLQHELAHKILHALDTESPDPLTDAVDTALKDLSPRAVFSLTRTVLYATGETVEKVADALTHCAIMSGVVPQHLDPMSRDTMCKLRSRFAHIERQWPKVAHSNDDELFLFAYGLTGDWRSVCEYARLHNKPELLTQVLHDRALAQQESA